MLTVDKNEFIFEFDTSIFNGGTYNVADNDYKATDGATGVDDEHPFVEGGSIFFNFNRKLSEDVATWFTKRCGERNNTFGKKPKELHFAVKGMLVFYRPTGDDHIYYILDDIVLAQGYSDPHNNWWFGGKNCSYIPSSDGDWKNTVVVAAEIRDTASGKGKRIGHALFRVKRGDGSGVYKAKVSLLHEDIDAGYIK